MLEKSDQIIEGIKIISSIIKPEKLVIGIEINNYTRNADTFFVAALLDFPSPIFPIGAQQYIV